MRFQVVLLFPSRSGNQNPGFVIAVVDTGCSMHPDLELILCPSDDPECGGYVGRV